jgi:carbon monoxide dehydrogenase subunit G
MELTETHSLPIAQQRTWEALNDTEILRACIPGCESIDADGENAYLVALSAAVGPVKARFKGRMQLTDIDAPNAYNIVFEGQGGAAGFAKGNARVMLEADGDTATKLTYTASAQVGGKLAQIGSRLVDGAARKIAGEFFKRFGAQVAGDGDGDSATAQAGDETTAAKAAQPDAESNDDTGAESGADATKRKRSWTAWISKS